jgi:hypothetical protein
MLVMELAIMALIMEFPLIAIVVVDVALLEPKREEKTPVKSPHRESGRGWDEAIVEVAPAEPQASTRATSPMINTENPFKSIPNIL